MPKLKPPPKKVVISAKVPPDLAAWLRQKAYAEGQRPSEYLREMLAIARSQEMLRTQ